MYSIAYQSRSGSPSDKWLEPDVRDVLKALPQSGVTEAVLAPIGFLSDHVEVLYDLDVDAVKTAAEHGVRMQRAGALNDHPLFIQMLADLIEARCAA
jgi:ferrochelatase